ncbi:MAG: Ig-like domain-containing protein [Pseudomonadota bacterium]
MSTFTFTALLESELLQGVNGSSIGTGDTFVMPDGATVEMIVSDDDSLLSGDYYSNENGDDSSGQTADINIDGELAFDDVKIYAESYHVLQGSDGNYYYMIEIELAGGNEAPGEGDDFFSFWGTTPPAGVSLSVVGTYNVTCDWIDFDHLDGGELINLEPENSAPIAVDDALVTDELTTISANLLDNDSDPDGDPITVTAIEDGTIGEAFEITTAKGYKGMVTVEADGSFTFDPGESFKELAQDEQDSFDLTYTISDDPSANVKHNLMFVLDISNSTIGAGGGENIFDGTGVGDVNNDGLANTVLDAEIAAVIAAVNDLIAQGVDPSNIDIGIATFSGIAAGFATVDAETLGTFSLDAGNLMDTLMGIQSGGWTNYEAGLQEAESWFAGQAGDGAQNKLIFLSDGRPISGYDYSAGQYITQTEADYGDEVSRIANDYGAEIYGIGVGANSDLDYLNDLDNTGGAERVLDANTLNVVVSNAVAQPASSTATVTVTINGLNEGPDALNDALTVDEDMAGAINILMNDSDPEGDVLTIVKILGNDGTTEYSTGDEFQVTTAQGNTGTVTVMADGTLNFDPGQGFESLNDTDTDSFVLSYTISDGQFEDTATVTVTVNGKGQPVDAMDDAYAINEDQDIAANVLDNDTPNDGSLKIISVADAPAPATATAAVAAAAAVSDTPVVGSEFTVTTEGGRTGTVTLAEDGTFTFDGGDNFIELAQGETDSFDLTYTVEGEAKAGDVPKHNVLFVIDISGSTSPATFGGSPVGDQNGDGVENSVLDAEIAAYKALSQTIAESGLTDDKVDIGLIVFSGSNGSDQTGASELLGTFKPGSTDLDAALASLTDGGFTNFEAPLQTGIRWFEDQAATTDDKNLVYFLSDGMQNVGGAFDDEATEMATRFGAELNAVGVGSGAVLDQLNQIDNTGGAEIVTTTDGLTAALVDQAPEIPGDQDTATITVTITGLNEAPTPLDDTLEAIEGIGGEVNILVNDSDPDGDQITLVSAGGVDIGTEFTVRTANQRSGTVIVDMAGKATFVPDETFDDLDQDEVDSVTFTYEITDGQFTEEATVTINVTGRNAPPEPMADSVVTNEGEAKTINILGNDTDPDGDALTIVNVNGFNVGEAFEVTTVEGYKGTVVVLSNGDLTFTPSDDFNVLNDMESATVSFDYTVTDGQFQENATVTVLVNGTGSANGKVTVSGSIAASVSGSTHVAVVIDTSVLTHIFADAKTSVDYDSDSKVGTISDLMLEKVLDLALTLNDSDTISVITSDASFDDPANQDGPIVIQASVATFKEAANDTAKAKILFAPIEGTYRDEESNIDLGEGFEAAAQAFTDIASDNNEVVVLTSTDTIDQSAAVAAKQSLVSTHNADIDVLYIEAGAFITTSNLDALDTDGSTSTTETIALASLIDEAPTTLANLEAFTIFLDGQKVPGITEASLTPNAADGTYTLSEIELELTGTTGTLEIIAAVDTDNDPTTAAEVFTYNGNANTEDPMIPDTLVFDFG